MFLQIIKPFFIRLHGKQPGHYRHQTADDDEEEEDNENQVIFS